MIARISAWTAHGLALMVSLLLLFLPTYSSLYVDIPGPREGVYIPQFEGTLLTENGLYVLPLLLFPILVSSVTVLAVHYLKRQLRTVLWFLGGLQMAFCAVLLPSIGILYVPTAAAMVVAATSASSMKGSTDW